MNFLIWFVAVELIVLHSVDGRSVAINAHQVTRLTQARDGTNANKQLHKDVRCVVNLTDGSYIGVVEECSTIEELVK